MSSLLWDKADARFSNQELAQLNEWAENHAKECQSMQFILEGAAFVTYEIRYCAAAAMFRTGIRCLCGKKYFTDENEEGVNFQ